MNKKAFTYKEMKMNHVRLEDYHLKSEIKKAGPFLPLPLKQV